MKKLSENKFGRCLSLLIVLVGILAVFPAQAKDTLLVGAFSAADPASGKWPEQWTALTFENIDRQTRYELVREDGTPVVRAQSHQAASGMIRQIEIDPAVYPIIEWRWKITGVYESGDVRQKSGDDYPARIYITFKYDPAQVGLWEKAKFRAVKAIHGEYPPVAAINYIWGSHAPTGTRVPNPYTERVHMIVVESGLAKKETWVTERRNLYEDYQAVFGQAPPLISGVAIMTDSDNTGESAVSYYGDIVFKKEP